MEIVSAQDFEGYWDNIDILRFLLGEEAVKAAESNSDRTAVITYLIVKTIEKRYNSGEYSLIIKKAYKWLSKHKFEGNYDHLITA